MIEFMDWNNLKQSMFYFQRGCTRIKHEFWFIPNNIYILENVFVLVKQVDLN